MNAPLMPIATAVWLIENTSLTFEQIADFCGLHYIQVHSIADGQVEKGIQGNNPITAGQLTQEEIERCQADPMAKLKLHISSFDEYLKPKKSKRAKYIPLARRQDKPSAIAWILKHRPEISDTQIVKLIGTTKETIESIRSKTYWNTNLMPQDPVALGLCLQSEIDAVYEKAKQVKVEEEEKKKTLAIQQLEKPDEK